MPRSSRKTPGFAGGDHDIYLLRNYKRALFSFIALLLNLTSRPSIALHSFTALHLEQIQTSGSSALDKS
jgi:hypothetical protein